MSEKRIGREISIQNRDLLEDPKILAKELDDYFVREGGEKIKHPAHPGRIGLFLGLSFINFYWHPKYGSSVCADHDFTTISLGGIESRVEEVCTNIEEILRSSEVGAYHVRDIDAKKNLKAVVRTQEGEYKELPLNDL
ncbi:MAG: hypothetical protein KAT77_05140 [Nanoarchaeota archaeon]|nr:hypothetical protein [Nanoarchaeota archaeon]